MNAQEHFDSLMKLCEGDSSFYFVDQVRNMCKYRIFSYRLAGYSEFLLPYARECRGHMFEIDSDGKMIRAASMAPTKFFNHMENPITMDLDFSDCDLVMDKADGSPISSYMQDGIYFKSKTSLNSEQAQAAMKLLHKFPDLAGFIFRMECNGYTVNLEYVSPNNRIVLPYQTDNLIVLSVRSRQGDTYGEYLDHSVIASLMARYGCEEHLVKNYANEIEDFNAHLNSINEMSDIEGFVIRIRGGETVKVKTAWYVALHRAKDSINSPKRLFEVVVNEAHDDLRGVFPEDQFLLDRIEEMEKLVQGIYANIKVNVEKFYNDNAGLDRKSYAILGTQTLPRLYFSLAMNLYLGKENDYKEWMIKHYKDFGIKDDPVEE